MGSYCPKCSSQFAESEGFCPHDGTPLVEQSPRTEDLQTRSVEVVSVLDEPSTTVALQKLQRPPKPSPYERLIGAVLDERYRIERKIGEGGMGVVFLARHIVIEKPVAVKVLKSQAGRDQSVITRFVQEARSASRIGHPGIVDVTDFGTTPDGMTYSVMEYVDGETLQQVIKGEGRLPVTRAVPIVAQLAKALSAAHEKGIVHRDLKPDNVFLLSRDGRRDLVKVGDFGIAKVTSLDDMPETPRLTHAGTIFGTPEYMAPEQASGRTDIDHRVDIYALGTIFYEMVVGRLPYKGETMLRTLAMQMLDPVTPPRQAHPGLEISDELEALILKAMAKKRDERFQSMKALLEELERAAGDISLTVAPVTSSPRRLSAAVATPGARTMIPDPTRMDSLVPTTEVPTMPPGLTEAGLQVQSAEEESLSDEDGLRMGEATLEPAFVRRKKPPTLDVFYAGPKRRKQQRKRKLWPLAAAAVLLVGGGGGIVAALLGRHSTEQPPARASAAAAAAAVAANASPGPADAGAAEATGTGVRIDAASAVVTAQGPAADAAVAARAVEGETEPPSSKKPSGRRTPGEPRTEQTGQPAPVESGLEHELLIVTRPEGANLYIDGTYVGQDGTRLIRPHGIAVMLECRLPGHQPGRVKLTFDGNTEVSLCRLQPMSRCVAGFKNPFGDCPEAAPETDE